MLHADDGCVATAIGNFHSLWKSRFSVGMQQTVSSLNEPLGTQHTGPVSMNVESLIMFLDALVARSNRQIIESELNRQEINLLVSKWQAKD